MKKYLVAICCLFPGVIAVALLKLIGQKVSWSSRVGLSIVICPKLILGDHVKIGHLNLIKVDEILLKQKAYIGHLNIIRGPLNLSFEETGAVGNSNIISRARRGVTYGKSTLKLGVLAKITARHNIDLTRNISIGDYSTIAGAGSQVWTHGYIHGKNGDERIRIDGEVILENNIYIGSGCVLNAGITIKEGITVGSNSTVSKNLEKPGMYVGQGLRFIEKDINDVRSSYSRVSQENLIEDVYQK